MLPPHTRFVAIKDNSLKNIPEKIEIVCTEEKWVQITAN